VAGAIAVKVFDSNVAAVGLSADAARAAGRDVGVAWMTGECEAHYWPDANRLHLQVVYERGTHLVLGVQAVGTGEVAKRVDVATQVVLRGGTLADLAEVEHAYAPPYAPAMEPLAVAAHAALTDVTDGLRVLPPLHELGDAVVLDVRTPEERDERPVTARRLLEIDLAEVGRRLDELPSEGLVVICAHGARSSEVVRRLRHHGIEAAYVAGGTSWRWHAGVGSGD
jgi:rhodanese-related sulfurtransferase